MPAPNGAEEDLDDKATRGTNTPLSVDCTSKAALLLGGAPIPTPCADMLQENNKNEEHKRMNFFFIVNYLSLFGFTRYKKFDRVPYSVNPSIIVKTIQREYLIHS